MHLLARKWVAHFFISLTRFNGILVAIHYLLKVWLVFKMVPVPQSKLLCCHRLVTITARVSSQNMLARVQTIKQTLPPIQKFPNLCTGLGKLPGQYHIKLMEGSKPYSLNVPQRVAVPLMDAVKLELK